mmetsp:Transcript_237/g.520  ORF Transcript_237/g.520 Transcript_237/m.520 type:complete len:443 (+) Transcript_237:307-1635(+)
MFGRSWSTAAFIAGVLASEICRFLFLSSTLTQLQIQHQPTPRQPPTPTTYDHPKKETRRVKVPSMCRCAQSMHYNHLKNVLLNSDTPVYIGALPSPTRSNTDNNESKSAFDTFITQESSIATGLQKHFVMDAYDTCQCMRNSRYADITADNALWQFLGRPDGCCNGKNCCEGETGNYTWQNMPDFGVEESLPLFVGVLSFNSPLSLNASMHSWLQTDLLKESQAEKMFIQLNNRSNADDDIVHSYIEHLKRKHQYGTPIEIFGDSEENLHPGLAIANFCRRAEGDPRSHPNGENLLLFLEKDWNSYPGKDLRGIFESARVLSQRGVHYMRLTATLKEISKHDIFTWPCPSAGKAWTCTTSHRHRWTNLPSIVSCPWFLRYFEPFALMQDPIMYGWKRDGIFRERKYFDWEEAHQDGRVAWSEAQWIVASVEKDLFFHHEVDR